MYILFIIPINYSNTNFSLIESKFKTCGSSPSITYVIFIVKNKRMNKLDVIR
jgi:hypothetical protein